MKNKLKTFLATLTLFTLVSCNNTAKPSSSSTTTYNVTFYLNDGTDKIYEVVETPFNTSVAKPDNPSRNGYIFRGWYVDSDCYVNYTLSTLVTSDISLYAYWIVDNSSSSSSSSSDNTSSDVNKGDVITYTIDSLPDWITNDNCVIFSWVWSDTNPGEWIDTTYTSDTSLTFSVDEEITGMLLVRCVSGTTIPDWEVTGDNSGRIYNQTEDIMISKGETNYSCSSWKEYNP